MRLCLLEKLVDLVVWVSSLADGDERGCTCASSPTSAWTTNAWPSSSASKAAADALSGRTWFITTFAPSRWKARAIAAPRPRDEPVTRTTCSVSFMDVVVLRTAVFSLPNESS